LAKDNIENMDRHQLRDYLASTQRQLLEYLHAGRLNFDRAMRMDRRKEAIEKRLSELEDYPSDKQIKLQSFPPDLS